MIKPSLADICQLHVRCEQSVDSAYSQISHDVTSSPGQVTGSNKDQLSWRDLILYDPFPISHQWEVAGPSSGETMTPNKVSLLTSLSTWHMPRSGWLHSTWGMLGVRVSQLWPWWQETQSYYVTRVPWPAAPWRCVSPTLWQPQHDGRAVAGPASGPASGLPGPAGAPGCECTLASHRGLRPPAPSPVNNNAHRETTEENRSPGCQRKPFTVVPCIHLIVNLQDVNIRYHNE